MPQVSLLEPRVLAGADVINIAGTVPAGGANVVETVPAGVRWRLLAANVRFTTDATVISRRVFITVTDNFVFYTANLIQLASEVFDYTISPVAFDGDRRAGIAHLPIAPEIWLQAGQQLFINAESIQAGDAFDNPYHLLVEQVAL